MNLMRKWGQREPVHPLTMEKYIRMSCIAAANGYNLEPLRRAYCRGQGWPVEMKGCVLGVEGCRNRVGVGNTYCKTHGGAYA